MAIAFRLNPGVHQLLIFFRIWRTEPFDDVAQRSFAGRFDGGLRIFVFLSQSPKPSLTVMHMVALFLQHLFQTHVQRLERRLLHRIQQARDRQIDDIIRGHKLRPILDFTVEIGDVGKFLRLAFLYQLIGIVAVMFVQNSVQ